MRFPYAEILCIRLMMRSVNLLAMLARWSNLTPSPLKAILTERIIQGQPCVARIEGKHTNWGHWPGQYGGLFSSSGLIRTCDGVLVARSSNNILNRQQKNIFNKQENWFITNFIFRLDVEVTPEDKNIHSILAQMTEIIKTYSERLPLYLFLTAFSQIISRICHPVKEVNRNKIVFKKYWI